MWEKAEKIFAKDIYLGPLVQKYGPCKIVPSRVEDYFEDLVSAIVGQQLSGKAAETIFNRVKLGVGQSRQGLSPTALLRTADDNLRNYGLSRAKILYIKDLATKVNGGPAVFSHSAFGNYSFTPHAKITDGQGLDLANLSKLPDEEVIQELTKVKGIGLWTAQMFLMFSLGRPDVFPAADLGIRKGMDKILKRELKSHELVTFAARWKPHRTVASWYIWRLLD